MCVTVYRSLCTAAVRQGQRGPPSLGLVGEGRYLLRTVTLNNPPSPFLFGPHIVL